VYESGDWFALANCENVPDGPWGDDDECLDWFIKNEKIVGVGDTPDDAVSDLLAKDEINQIAQRISKGQYRIGKSSGTETIF